MGDHTDVKAPYLVLLYPAPQHHCRLRANDMLSMKERRDVATGGDNLTRMNVRDPECVTYKTVMPIIRCLRTWYDVVAEQYARRNSTSLHVELAEVH